MIRGFLNHVPNSMNKKLTSMALAVSSCFGAGHVAADEDSRVLSPVVVTATRVEQDSFDLPMAIDKVERQNIDNQLRMTLSESLARIPGITAQNRNQMAQDPQISSRGFGARSSFGVRGIRVYVDGIPLSMPDGIGNPGSVDLDAIGSIEVMRGPFSAMYGNSSGGVLQLLTKKPGETPVVGADVLFGSFNTRRESIEASGVNGGLEYQLNLSDYSSNGFRAQSKNDKQQATVKLGTRISDDTKLSTLINWFDQSAQDPGGLVRTGTGANQPGAFPGGQFYDPTGATRGAIVGNTRVNRSNTQIGFNLEKTIDANNTVNVITYAGQRDNLQYLASSNAPTGTISGRASSIGRTYYGTDVRLTNRGDVAGKAYQLSVGLNLGYMDDARLDRNATNGVIQPGAANRDENQTAYNIDQYAQGLITLDEQWDLHAGIRHTRLKLDVKPNPGATANIAPGSLSFDRTMPVVGLVYKATPTLNYYANIGTGFETPTLVEISYSDPANAAAGLNLGLKPSTSTNIEVGAKALLSDTSRLNVALFDISTDNEIVIDRLNGTTASYRNAGKTQRRGVELSAEALLQPDLSAYVAYTFLDASFQSPFATGTGATAPGNYNSGTVAAGSAIPGTYRQQLYAELAYRYRPYQLETAIEGRYNSKVFINDLNKDAAPAYTIFSIRASLQQVQGKWKFTEYARIDNLFDQTYIGSVRVNDGNTRFFEPAPGRNYFVGVKASYMF